MKRNIYFYTSILFILLNSCSTNIKPKTQKSGKNLYETFFVGEEGSQYFLKPLTLKNENESLVFDSTFRYKKNINDSKPVDFKFSLLSPNFIKEIETLTISNNNTSILINKSDIELLFNEKAKRGYTSRFIAKMSLIDLKKLHKNSNWKITINKRKPFTAGSKTQKSITTLNEAVFVIL